jgi:hypothetical protein
MLCLFQSNVHAILSLQGHCYLESRRMKWVGHVARMGEKRKATRKETTRKT